MVCGDTVQYLDFTTLPIDGTTNFGSGDSSGLKAEPPTPPAKRHDKARNSETAQGSEILILLLDETTYFAKE